jgi:hypothetical protein
MEMTRGELAEFWRRVAARVVELQGPDPRISAEIYEGIRLRRDAARVDLTAMSRWADDGGRI